MSYKVQRLFAATLACTATVILFTCPYAAQRGIADGLTMCAETIIPSLFPFMAVAGFIARSGAARVISYPLRSVISPLFGIPHSACWVVILSFIGGYPVGAAGVAGLCASGCIDRRTAARMLTFCVNAGPAMVILAVGGRMLGSVTVGWVLYASHIGAAILTGVIFALVDKKKDTRQNSGVTKRGQSIADAFVEAVSDSSTQMLVVCGYVVLFAAVTAFFEQWGADWASVVAEVTCGTRWAANSGWSAPMISAVLGFGGVSVMCQAISLSHGLIGMGRLLLSRVINAVISFLLCSAFIKLIPDAVSTMSNLGGADLSGTVTAVPLSISMLLMAAVFLSSTTSRV